jgi:hypothetical protein
MAKCSGEPRFPRSPPPINFWKKTQNKVNTLLQNRRGRAGEPWFPANPQKYATTTFLIYIHQYDCQNLSIKDH